MKLFKRRKDFNVQVEAQHDSRVEVVVHKNATREAVQTAKEANQKLNDLLLDNGFTLKIVLGMTGKPKRKTNAT